MRCVFSRSDLFRFSGNIVEEMRISYLFFFIFFIPPLLQVSDVFQFYTLRSGLVPRVEEMGKVAMSTTRSTAARMSSHRGTMSSWAVLLLPLLLLLLGQRTTTAMHNNRQIDSVGYWSSSESSLLLPSLLWVTENPSRCWCCCCRLVFPPLQLAAPMESIDLHWIALSKNLLLDTNRFSSASYSAAEWISGSLDVLEFGGMGMTATVS